MVMKVWMWNWKCNAAKEDAGEELHVSEARSGQRTAYAQLRGREQGGVELHLAAGPDLLRGGQTHT